MNLTRFGILLGICLLCYYIYCKYKAKRKLRYIYKRNDKQQHTQVNKTNNFRDGYNVDVALPYNISVITNEIELPTNLNIREYIIDYADNYNEFNDNIALYDIFNYDLNETEIPLLARDDPQSVHDTYIQSKLKKDFKNKLHSTQTPQIPNETFEKLRETSSVKHVIDKIEKRNSTLSGYENKTEMEILKETWENGDENIKNQIINSLKDCIEDEKLVCATGVVSRILSSNYINNPDEFPKTKEILHSEIMYFVNKIRDNTPEDQFTSEYVKQEINKEFSKTLSKDQIDNLTKDWIEYV